MTAKSVSDLMSTCAVCGAEESLDALMSRMTEDDNVRRLIADVVTKSVPLGVLVVRYLRLHKPAKQKLRLDKVAKVLGELLADMQRGSIERKGRSWSIDTEGWKLAMEAVFTAQTKGTITLPLDGNAYLYEVVMRLSDKAEGEAEKAAQSSNRGRGHTAGAKSITDLINSPSSEGVARSDGVAAAPVIAPPRKHEESRYAKALKAEIAAKLALRTPQTEAD